MRNFSLLSALLACVSLGLAASAGAEVPTTSVRIQQQARQITAEASIEAVHQATLAAQIPGRVTAVHADAGDRVNRGQLLLDIDPSEVNAATASAAAGIARARTALSNAETELQRARSLVANNFLSQSALDLALTRHEAARAELAAARAQHQQTRAVQAYAQVSSPLTGLVASRHIEAGEMAQPGRLLFTIYDPAHMRAVADLAPQRLAELGSGPLQATVELAADGRRILARQVTVLPAADANTHTVRVRVELPAGSEGLAPGSFARIHFQGASGTASLSIPQAAVLRRGELSAVYVANADGSFSLRQLRLGRKLADSEGGEAQIEVLSGLSGDERIALDPVQAGILGSAAAR